MGYHRLTVEHVVLSHNAQGSRFTLCCCMNYTLHALYHRLYQTLAMHHFGSEWTNAQKMGLKFRFITEFRFLSLLIRRKMTENKYGRRLIREYATQLWKRSKTVTRSEFRNKLDCWLLLQFQLTTVWEWERILCTFDWSVVLKNDLDDKEKTTTKPSITQTLSSNLINVRPYRWRP